MGRVIIPVVNPKNIIMSAELINSKAFQLAALRSESLRIKGLIVLIGALCIYALARSLGVGSARLLIANIVLVVFAIGYELLMLRYVERKRREEGEIPQTVWLLNVLIETQIPTIALVMMIRNQGSRLFRSLSPRLFSFIFCTSFCRRSVSVRHSRFFLR